MEFHEIKKGRFSVWILKACWKQCHLSFSEKNYRNPPWRKMLNLIIGEPTSSSCTSLHSVLDLLQSYYWFHETWYKTSKNKQAWDLALFFISVVFYGERRQAVNYYKIHLKWSTTEGAWRGLCCSVITHCSLPFPLIRICPLSQFCQYSLSHTEDHEFYCPSFIFFSNLILQKVNSTKQNHT